MALVKFNRTATKATAIGSSKDADTLYFPTDEQSIYLGGKRVGGDSVSHAVNADHATNAGHATNADNATNAGTAGKVGNTLTLKLNSGSAKTFNGSADVTFDVTPSGIGAAPTIHTHTPSEVGAAPTIHNHDSVYSKLGHTHTASEVGAAPSNHTHDIKNITSAGDAAKMGVDTYISNAPSSSNLPTSSAVKDYIDRQIKNYTSAFRYAGTLSYSTNKWILFNIPADISETGSMDYGTFEGGSPDDTFLQTGFTFYVMSDGTFNGEQVEPGDMVTCVDLYDGEGRWEPSYHIVNGNITVTEKVDNSTKVPTAGAVKSAISTAVSGLDGSAIADNNYVLTGVLETDGVIVRHSQVAVDQTFSPQSANPASGKAIAAAIQALDSTKSASSGKAITGITMVDGKISSITETAVNNYTHPSHTATTGVPTANAAPGFGGTFQVNQISSDSQGHVTSSTSRTITIPATEASTSTKGLMTPTHVGDINQLKADVATLMAALTWK